MVTLMWLCSLPNDRGLIFSLLLCWSFPILFRNRVSLICHCKEVLLLGQILEKLLRRLGWTDSCFLQIGRISFQQFLKDGCLGCARIIFQLSLRVALFREGVCRLDLRICGLRMRVLWIWFDLGGIPIRSMHTKFYYG